MPIYLCQADRDISLSRGLVWSVRCDELTLEKTPEGLSMTADSEELPTDESNLVCKAARLMQETFHIPGGVRFHLKKRIPIAAGMAGGSTDAASLPVTSRPRLILAYALSVHRSIRYSFV